MTFLKKKNGILIAIGVLLLVYMGFFLFTSYRSQLRLQKFALDQWQSDVEKKAGEIGEFLSRCIRDTEALAETSEISAFFENRDLGMSMLYGLRASLNSIRRLFENEIDKRQFKGEKIYDRIAFIGRGGEPLVMAPGRPADVSSDTGIWKRWLTPERSSPRMVVSRESGKTYLLVSRPYFFKGEYNGQLLAWISLNVLKKNFLQLNSRFPEDTIAILHSGKKVLGANDAPARNQTGKAMAKSMVLIKTTPLILLWERSEDILYAKASSRTFFTTMAVISLFVFGMVVLLIRANTKGAILNARIEEGKKREEAVQAQNILLSDEIVARKKVEMELREAKEAAEEAARAKSAFLANMSHEIRTPLNSVLGFLGLSMEDPSLPDQHREYLGIARGSAKSLLGVINDILNISELQNGKLTLKHRPFNLGTLLGEVRDTMRVMALEKKLDLRLDTDPGISGTFMGDDLRLRQIFVNLLNNAVKFTEKGHVCLSAKPEAGEEGYFHFVVEDTGIGIPADCLEDIFESFTQVDESMSRKFSGTGLGTAICRELVTLMGGRIWVESQEGIGSSFHIILALTPADLDAETAGAAAEQSEGHQAPSRSFNILLAEDVRMNVKLAKARLEKNRHRVTVALNGREAVDAWERGGLDIILMDVQMPETDGIQATREIRAREARTGSRIPIIATTGSATPEETCRYQEAGIDAVVEKPVDFDSLERVMADLVPAGQGRIEEKTEDDEVAQATFKLPPMEGIDTEKARIRWGDMDVYAHALVSFPDDYGHVTSELTHLIEDGDLEKARRLSHTLKGVAANLSIIRVAELAAEIDAQLKQGLPEEAIGRLSDLNEAMACAVRSIRQMGQNECRQSAQASCEKGFDEPAVKRLLSELILGLEQFSPYAVKPLISQLENYIEPQLLAPIAQHIDAFDFDGARQETLQLAGQLGLTLD